MIRLGASSRSAWVAAFMLAPVAKPSSTTMTVLAANRQRGPALPVQFFAAFQLDSLSRRNLIDKIARELQFTDQRLIQNADAPACNRSDGQLFLTGQPKLSNQEDIQFRSQGSGDLEGNRHTTARKGQNQ